MPAPSPLLSRRQINLIVGGLVVGMFLAALDQMIVATAIRTIGDDLNGLTLQAWVTTAYLIASTISTPLYGKLSDIYGRKPLYVISLSLFVLGSLLCGTAGDMYQLAGYRALQGLGAGGLMALALIIVGDILSPRERTKYQAAFFGVWGIASVLGPVLGGFFAGADAILGVAGWRWIFLLNVPLGLIALAVILRVLHVPHSPHHPRIDYWGVAALITAIVPMLLVVEQGRSWGWTSPSVLALAALSVVGIAGFVVAERAAQDDALLPLRMFRNRTVAVSTGLNFVMGFAMFGGMAGLPLYLQIAKGMEPTQAGLAMLPMMTGIMAMAGSAAPIIHRTGRYKPFPVVGGTLLVVAGLVLSRLEAESSMWFFSLGAFLFGLGLGGIMQPVMLAVQNAVEPRDMGAGSASVMFFRQIGGSLGTAIFLSILFSSVTGDIAEEFEVAAQTPEFQEVVADPATLENPVNAQVLAVVQSGSLDAADGLSLDDTSFLSELDPVLAAPFRAGFADAIANVLLMTSLFSILGLALAIALPQLPLREKSGLETMRDGDHAIGGGAAADDADRTEGADLPEGDRSP
ncbi:MDR family MFS transporter [Demequina sp. SYSU T00039]|uniref:MDR family MFS transporter n=1 Tax=Demequina lignilytica TaxID=3051663 RepID=A0AAW7M8X9_9MICO|nr:MULTISPECIES: MDR family MFS transporter [unclassified Demequina]MDN4477902.1 MDR family MFS transporter [Demequina sp. SYSU T00039-1]MDN4487811.1 MDR family MFS transporter [Demequina sp. SYSU T00039]MDN4490806.1 MDR family MFS transporter [Demequina sp. SYSU T00068]